MDPNLENRLISIERQVAENNKILSQMRRVQKNANLVKGAYWLILIVMSFVAYIFIKPYIAQLGQAYGLSSNESKDDTNDKKTAAENLLKQLQQFQDDNN